MKDDFLLHNFIMNQDYPKFSIFKNIIFEHCSNFLKFVPISKNKSLKVNLQIGSITLY